MAMRKLNVLLLLVLTSSLLAGPVLAAPAKKGGGDEGGSLETLRQYVADLKKNPDNVELREKIIKHAQTMKQRPPVPEEYERQSARGGAYVKKAADKEGHLKAVESFTAAVAAAPWMAEGYVDLADAQEKAGMYAEAIQSLNFALLADPGGKNNRELRNRVYELEVFAEDARQKLKESPMVPPPPPPPPPTVAKPAPQAKKQAAPEKPEKKTSPRVFVGNWYYKDTAPRGGQEITAHAFTISMNEKGELAASAPRRSSGAVGTVSVFEISGEGIHIQVSWKLPSIPSYWKTEDYDLELSKDETKLSGPYKITSSGSREFGEDKTLFKQ
jgi:tetratricopeptide (TPR) repeat protein